MENNNIEEKFEKIYQTKIAPKLKNLENFRLEEKKKFDSDKKSSIILFLSSIGLFLFVGLCPILMIILLVLAIFFGAKLHKRAEKISNDFRKTLKQNLLIPVISLFGDFKIEDSGFLTLKEIKELGFYKSAKKQKDDDIIKGKYKEISIEFLETKLTHKEGGENSTTITDFDGLIIKIKMNKKFYFKVIGKQKTNFENSKKLIRNAAKMNPELYAPEQIERLLNNKFIQALLKLEEMNQKNSFPKSLRKNLEKIALEDSEFNENFEIYSDDKAEAKYFLTPSFIEKIKHIQEIFLTTKVNFAFSEGAFYLFLDRPITKSLCTQKTAKFRYEEDHGLFEVGDISETLFNKKIYLKLFKELYSIFSLINYLKIDKN